MGNTIDTVLATKLHKEAEALKSEYSIRDKEFDEYEDAYLCKAKTKLSGNLVKHTMSPTARNKVEGIVRLLSSQNPIFRVVSYATDDEEKIEHLEKMLARWWDQSGRLSGQKLLKEMMLSAVLYDEMHTVVTPLKDYAEKNKNDKRIQEALKITPVLFQSWKPRNGYPNFDELGLNAYYRIADDNWANVRQKYAGLIDNVNTKTSGTVKVELYYDLTHFCVWIDGTPIITEEHGLSAIPINVTVVNGSSYFDKREDQRQPVLFSLMRSKLWERENMMYTILFSNMFSIGMTPLLIHKSSDASPLSMKMDESVGFSVAQIGSGDSLDFLINKGVLPSETQSLMQLTSDAINNSTIQNTAFGERYAGDMTFSETSLLAQAARLPLVHPQKMGGFGISSVMQLALQIMKDKGITYNNNGITIKPKDIPDDLDIQVTLDVILPQERLQLGMVAKTMVDSGFISTEYAQNNILGISNTNEMSKQILEGQAVTQFAQVELQRMIQQMQQAQAVKDAQKERLLNQFNHQQMPAPQEPIQPEAQEITPPPIMPVQEPKQTGTDVEMESLSDLYNSTMGGMVPGQGEALGGMGLPPQMGGMVPGTSGLSGLPEGYEDMR